MGNEGPVRGSACPSRVTHHSSLITGDTMAKVIGIDLGTTNSVVAVMEAGEPTVIPNAEGSRLTPSVVAVNPKTGERMVGQVAKRQAITNPDNTIFSIKRFMGRKFDDPDVQRDKELVPYKVSAGAERRRAVQMGDKRYSPQEISAMILQKLKADAEAYLGETVTAGGDHRAGLLQRLRSARRPRTRAASPASKCCASSTSPRRRRWPTAWTRRQGRDDRRLRPRRRHLRHLDPASSARASSRSVDQRRHAPRRRRLRPADHRLVWSTSSSASRASTCARTAWRCSA